ncbi:MAG: phenylalanine--tRNA ligase subunit beta [Oscillospiraceae bacterium]|nr:phenylalanine--tRNA ligase subunit beta [Oscillospiraceae bacterium]
MKLNRKWLHEEFVDLSSVSDKEYVEKLTIFGQKVETWERLDSQIKNVKVGKVVSIVRHENSDHMWVCQVDVGEDAPVQIVTGAQNVQQGDLVPVALHNSYLPGGVHITKGKLRGEVSNGMLCGLEELGLTLNDFPNAILDGIWILNDEDCTVGQDINTVIGNDDTVVDFEITNNRPDCYSVIGLARESAAAFGMQMKHHEPTVKGSDCGSIFEMLDVDVPATELCNRYSSRMVKNVKIAPSPKWLRARLRANGIRPINNIVDITNYVMLEYGQPMHAFDYRYVSSGKIIVREAEEGETLTTLDGNVRNLKPGMLVIADENKPIGLAGIMGGENSEILDDTTTVVFESANFNGTSIRQTALALGMRTESSGKFEKNLDPMMTVPAVQRACELVELLEAGDVMDGIIDIINYVPEEKTLPLECDKINRLLGTDISKEDMVKYLNLLEIEVDGDTIKVPSFRPDLNLMADVAEEVGRSFGYNEIATTAFKTSTQGGYSPYMLAESKAGALCRSLGYSEIITYSFVSPAIFDQIRLPGDSKLRDALRIQNPLGEDTSIMRTIALPSMLDILSRNYAYHNKAAKLYELAKIYLPTEGEVLPAEPKMLVLGTYGANETFFTLKGELEAILTGLRMPKASYTAVKDNPSYHPGRCAMVSINGIELGYMGQVHPLVCKNYGMDAEVYCVEIDFSKLFTLQLPDPTYTPLPKYPTVSRDLAIVCDEAVTVAEAENVITAAAGKLLRGIRLFDIYRGVGVPDGKKSMAFSLELRSDDRTLTDQDSEAVMTKVLNALKEKLGAILR